MAEMTHTIADLVNVIAVNMQADPTDPRISATDGVGYSALEEYALSETDHLDIVDRSDEYNRLTRTGPITGMDLLLAAYWANGRTLI